MTLWKSYIKLSIIVFVKTLLFFCPSLIHLCRVQLDICSHDGLRNLIHVEARNGILVKPLGIRFHLCYNIETILFNVYNPVL